MNNRTLALTLVALATACGSAPAQTVVDGFERASDWKTIASEGVEIVTSTAPGREGNCLRIQYHFKSGSGFCIVQRAVSMALPEGNFELAFDVKGDGPANDLEFKILDTGGDLTLNAEKSDVWWLNRRGYEPPREWTTLRNVRRNITHAWGPTGGKNGLNRADKVEFAIASKKGGRGTIYLDSLTLREIAAPPDPLPAPVVKASSAAVGSAEAPKLGSGGGAWRPAPLDRTPSVVIDFGYERELSALTLFGEALRSYSIWLSDDGVNFRESRRFEGRSGDEQLAPLWDVQSRFVRILFDRDDAGELAVHSVAVHGPEEYPDAAAVALRDAPKEQRYWTVLGRPDDVREALINEDGIVEVNSGGFSLAPRLVWGGRPLAMETVAVDLVDGSLPMPVVKWKAGSVSGETRAWVTMDGPPRLWVTYSVLANGRPAPAAPDADDSVRFVVDVLPRQVNPKWQFLTTPGGFAPVRSVAREGGLLLVNEAERVVPLPVAKHMSAAAFGARSSPAVRIERPWERPLDSGAAVRDDEGLASAALVWELGAAAGQVGGAPREPEVFAICVPFDGADAPGPDERPALSMDAAVLGWHKALDRTSITLPGSRAAIAATAKSTLAHILINADGPAIQPGSRSYERSWIRDGALTSAALLKFGFEKEAVAFIDWYADHLIEIAPGVLKAPCVVDSRGPDPVPENDSHGEYVFAVYNAYMHTKDRTILERHWPKVQAVAAYMDRLRASRMTQEFRPGGPKRQEPGKPALNAEAFYGLMPESISHEGYSSKPMHSHWDNLWTLRGFECAARIAEVLDAQNAVDGYDDAAESMRISLATSVTVATAAHKIDYMPGCVELGDFDSTSTTMAVWPCDVTTVDGLAGPVLETFERYWKFFEQRAATGEFEAFTPYELRHVGAYARLGMRDRAGATLDWYMGYRRPAAWNQWAEVVWHDPRTPKFIGDMPHTWCGSDFLNSVATMMVYEKDDALEVFRGVPATWMDGDGGVSFERVCTWYGKLSGSAKGFAKAATPSLRVEMELTGNAAPKGGFFIESPRNRPVKRCTVNGEVVPSQDNFVNVRALPAAVVFEYEDGSTR
ncbi:MAG: hypothetical protein ACOYN0_04385 [Phycisphaerales bacterium]